MTNHRNMKSNKPSKTMSLKVAMASAVAIGASTLPMFALQPGDAVSLNALTKSEFIKGEAPKEWKTNQVYILECWATWCGPCVAAIPHVDSLYDKYHGKGLNIIGVNVLEDDRDIVAAFVAKKGDGMSYPVAYTGSGGDFEKEWLKPAGVNGIPHAFLVKNGRLLTSIHPASLNEKMIEALLAGGDAETTLVKKLLRARDSQDEIKTLVGTFSSQASARDYAAAKATLAKIRDLDENYVGLPGLEMGFAALQEKWNEVESMLTQDKSSMTAMMLGVQLESATNKPPTAVLKAMLKNLNGLDDSDPIGFGVKASLLSQLGMKEEAFAAAQKAAKALLALTKGTLPKGSLDPYVNSHKTDKPMRLMDAFGIIRDAVPKNGR